MTHCNAYDFQGELYVRKHDIKAELKGLHPNRNNVGKNIRKTTRELLIDLLPCNGPYVIARGDCYHVTFNHMTYFHYCYILQGV